MPKTRLVWDFLDVKTHFSEKKRVYIFDLALNLKLFDRDQTVFRKLINFFPCIRIMKDRNLEKKPSIIFSHIFPYLQALFFSKASIQRF